ncbi:peptidoglycan glycosyltransferase FtsW [Corynebacterium pygosceleis]|uniref:Probable peptidoglycan glycosyltransferase FtsW n=1 Tax=Corynebacterium pygosceleis TaxID=2800406 RepID=A0A9Q4C6V2_9CORY|nr:putative peptidoglycan glycosyltransferase FtsW [Corynebacterium pygosceleis]MCK7636648.1 putative lipid II flippase FtsW [Corynebacterium pygosceleis]MCK7675222.1 putative lipid II flippase FtsW [Corynebacterium pygosceleis]MCL0120563.1 putative lipid II flippase FtsW [Corynebacterium pygosceleis]MCX7444114.1 putative peptidoglycan glycosyltransferase FtsW [Corynebacterium pygosceleis]MCX7467401.1 putative peptidoglycan glycosyltransferase FtsW [Corynebacterium pygosceleis]
MTQDTTARGQSAPDRLRAHIRDYLSRPFFDYFLILSVVALITAVGAVMVLSSSTTWSALDSGVWTQGLRHMVFLFVGYVVLWLALWMRPSMIRRLATPLLLLTIVLLCAVLIPGVGTGLVESGARSWLALGPFTFQPSELAKVTLAVWGAHYLSDRGPVRHWLNNHYMHYCGVTVLIVGLILRQPDVGMAVVCLSVAGLVLVFAGIPGRFITGMVAAGGVLAVGYALVSTFGGGEGNYRTHRLEVYKDALLGDFDDVRGKAFQSYQGFLSLAEGGTGGVGPGQSRAKWFYLPEAKNDFIFAIIGEETGLVGGTLVILLFGALGLVGLRCAMRSTDPYLKLLAATLTAGVVSQAFVNIGYVVGLLPVTGIQLPMISSGGSSAIITVGSMGLLASAARHEPEAVSTMQSYGRPAIDRLLRLREPDPAGSRGAVRRRARPVRQSTEPVTHRRGPRSSAPSSTEGRQPPRPTGPGGGSVTGGAGSRRRRPRPGGPVRPDHHHTRRRG